VIIESGFWEDISSPRARIAYLFAVQSRWSRHSWKSASVRVVRNWSHAASKPAFASSNVAPTLLRPLPGSVPG